MTVQEVLEVLKESPLYSSMSLDEAMTLAMFIAGTYMDGTVNDIETL
jgi:hypothetical protein